MMLFRPGDQVVHEETARMYRVSDASRGPDGQMWLELAVSRLDHTAPEILEWVREEEVRKV